MEKYKYESYDYSVIGIGISKTLKAIWSSTTTLGDINTFHNFDAERELTAILSEQIAAEIDREIIASLSTYTGSISTYAGPINTPTYVSNRENFINAYNNG